MSRRSHSMKSGRVPVSVVEPLAQRLAGRHGDVDEGDLRALPDKALGQRRADAGAATGDQHGGVLEVGEDGRRHIAAVPVQV